MAGQDQLNIRLDYNANRYEPGFVKRISAHIKEIINRVVHNDELEIRRLTLLTHEEKKTILYDFNNTETEFPLDKPFHRLFEEQVRRTPHRVAVLGPSVGGPHGSPLQFTYEELNKKSNQLAGYLLRESSIRPGSLVAVLMERSEKMVESILAIWKSGGAYIPLDTENAPERIDSLLRDSGAAAVLTEKPRPSLKSRTPVICLEESVPKLEEEKHTNPLTKVGKDDMAYVIYTSGSTGKSKGAVVEHVGMLNHIYSKIGDMEVDARSVLAQNASQCFDISVWQFFSALVVGGRTVIYNRELVLNTGAFTRRITNDGITVLEMVPSHLSVFLDVLETEKEYRSHRFQGLEYLVTTGEAVKPVLVNRCLKRFPGIKVVNAYGPTETSDDITHYIMSGPPDVDTVPLGTPLPNFKIYIVDKGLNLCPIGIKGEIVVSGIGVGRGY